MKSAEEWQLWGWNKCKTVNCECVTVCRARTEAIRAAQIVAAEWMREEAAKVADMAARMLQEKARAHSDPGDRLMYLSVADVSTGTATDIRSIKLPGDGE